MAMEKINSEELKKMLGRIPLSDDELENVTGGNREEICQQRAQEKFDSCMAQYAMKSQCEKQRQNTYNSCMRV